MNDALEKALRLKGIRTHEDRERWSREIGISERSLRRWRNEEDSQPHWLVAEFVAKNLGRKPEELWPQKEKAA